jgi:hypothetical protein
VPCRFSSSQSWCAQPTLETFFDDSDVALVLAALVGADELRSSHYMLLGFSLNVADVRISVEAEAYDINRK